MTCPCGRPLHYKDPAVQAMVEQFIHSLGEHVPINVEGDPRTFLVSRHYIALHGFTAQDLIAGRVPVRGRRMTPRPQKAL